jgi:D-alanyl-lipoteichoic acid acyltransferase DltB (MBOAT superfamily)
VQFQAAAPSIVLPLGISFYTFETISYLVDVYRQRIKPWKSFLDYALFLTFFPHLVAGPIVRAYDFLPQCIEPKRASRDQLGWGVCLLIVGLFEKVFLADGLLAPVVDRVYGAAHQAGFLDSWVGTFAFAGQIFFDFAGYSTCGIGAALCLGFVLCDNFRFPYAAVGFSEFWQRWHISLSTWLRDYLYIPLGGNRRGRVRTQLNLLTTMLLGGLWHGASWRFVAWGGLHGLYLVGERGLRWALGQVRAVPQPSPVWVQAPLAMVTFLLVCITWVFFRAATFGDAFHLLGAMSIPTAAHPLVNFPDIATALGITLAMLVGHWALRNSSFEVVMGRTAWWARSAVLAGMCFCLLIAPGESRAFIYFQF